ncbi:wall-associated receptor kinase 1-like [Aegilops tauschii subsp. strangulata]
MYGYQAMSKRFQRGVPFVLDFSIVADQNSSCPPEGQQPPHNYACLSGNSFCTNTSKLSGYNYVCWCDEYYEGNPYLTNGCQDIDECKNPALYPCSSNGVCKNRLRGYDCPCKRGMKGDGIAGTCKEIFPLVAKVIVAAAAFILAMVALFIYFLWKEKKKTNEFYTRNGGPILEKAKFIKIFKKEELKPIIKKSNFIGKGGFGEVYKGLIGNELVAVKKPISGSVLEIEQFKNEVIIQSQVIHKNIVRLKGCCLEVDIPMLVYEFLSKGSLEDILHSDNKLPLNMDLRLKIVAESADGLAYMHSKTTTKILHSDVKPANILLDDTFAPKISDFGISRLIARDKEHTQSVIGDRSYMDPLYLETGLLTEKSDVYSFGVVILELISRKKATYSDNNSLAHNLKLTRKRRKQLSILTRILH